MFTHSYTSVALFSSSTVSAVAIPVDSSQATLSLAQQTVAQEVAQVNNLAENNLVAAADSCKRNTECINAATVAPESQAINSWFAEQDGYSTLQPVIALVLIMAVLVVFLSRKSTSTK